MLGAIIITITNKDGTKTRIEVPDTSKVEITNAPIENQKSKIENAKVWHGWPADAPPPAIAPFDAEQAQHHQAAWAKYLGVPVACTNSVGMTFVLVPPGEFLMGSTPEKIVESLLAYGTNAEWRSWAESEAPQHRVRISKPFYLAIHKVTQQQYELVMGTNPSSFSMTGAQKEDVEGIETKDFPVDSVAWTDAVQFCEKLAARERQSSESANGGQPVEGRVKNGYRLPTEAEWEFAARGGTTTRSWNGDSDNALLSVDWLGPNNDEKHPHPVGELPANPFGLHDVLGSLFEWCHDGWTKSDYEQYRDELAIDPLGIDTPDAPRTLRGGLWADSIRLTHIASRRAVPASLRDNRLGLRIALSVEAVKTALLQLKPAELASANSWFGWPADAPPPAIAPFDAEQAQHHQEAWAKYLGVPAEYTNSLGMKFRLIPPGEFTMGSTPTEIAAALKDVAPDENHWRECIQSEAPQNKVILSQPIYLGVNEVTQAEYEKVMGVNPSHFAPMGMGKEAVAGLDTTSHPVEMVSWNDAAEFCAKLSQQEKLKPFYFRAGETITPLDGTGYRLPSEAEWECACRAGTATKYWIGDKDEDLVRAGWFLSNSGRRTHAVGELMANPFGFWDIHGNVWEWAEGRWEPTNSRKTPNDLSVRPNEPSIGSRRVIRGGSFYFRVSYSRTSTRLAYEPDAPNINIGLRVSLTLEAVRQALKVTGPAMTKLDSMTKLTPARDPIDFAAERAAAEWVLANKGAFSIAASPDWQWRDYGASDNEKPLPSEPFVITALHMTNSQVKTESDLERLTRCRYLENLTIGGGTIEGPAMDLLTRLPRLKSLVFDQKNLRTSDLSKLGQISTLDFLSITSNMVDDKLEFVRHLPTLRSLKIWGPQPPDIDLLAEAPQLRTILLTTPDAVDDAKLVAVQSRNDKLRIVVGWKGKYRTVGRDPTHEAAKQLVELGVECLGGVNYWQAPSKLLTKADFENGGVWSFSVQKIPASVQLSADDREKLKLLDSYHFIAEGQRESDELAKSLSGNHGIATITMTDCDLTDIGLEHLQKLVSLRNINVTKTKVTPAGVERFHRAVPYCGITSDFGVILPHFMSAATTIPAAPASDRIDFAAERKAAEWVLENKGTMSIAVSPDWSWRDYGASDNAKPLPSEPFVVTILGMTNSQVKTESDLERLTRCRYLEILGISGGTIESPAIDLLTRLPRLKTLTLSDQKNLRTSDLPKLGQISALEHLAITSDMVDDRLEFVRHLPALRTLNIYGPQPPDISLLAEAPQLRTILLPTPDTVDDDKLAAAQARHGQLRIVVGWKGKYRTVGRDPAHEAAKQLVELGVECFGGVNYFQPRTKLLTKADFENGGVWSFSVQKIPASVQLSADDREKLKLLDSYHFTAEGQREADELAKSLSGNHGIATITMTDCDLTDVGLEHLQKLVSLRNINVTKTKVTPAGVERFHRAVPYCWITSDFGVTLPKFISANAAQPK